MKIEEKKKICNQLFLKIFLILFISFLAIYLSAATGYYEFEQHNKMILTKEKIKEFEKDVSEGKKVDIKNYIINDDDNYKNNISRLGKKISITLSNTIETSIETISEVFNKILEY